MLIKRQFKRIHEREEKLREQFKYEINTGSIRLRARNPYSEISRIALVDMRKYIPPRLIVQIEKYIKRKVSRLAYNIDYFTY